MARVSSESSTSSWRTALRLSWADRALFLEAVMRLAAARLVVVVLPFKAVAARLGEHESETPRQDDPAVAGLLRRVRWAVLAASRRAPWCCKCLEQAIAAKMMLRSRGIATTLYLGVARLDAIEAHAWLRCGSAYIVGGDGASRFAVVSSFGEKA